MTVSLTGMTLHTNNDNEGNWSGTDGPDDYNNAVQGTNSEAWQVSKNSSETGTLSVSSTLNATRGIFTFWMSSNLAPYYTNIEVELQSTTNNYKNFEVATSLNKAIGGDFVATAIDYVNNGTETGTFAPASFSTLRITVDNSTSGNIRSVINNWIDAMYYGEGHTVTGTTTTDKLFNEIAVVDNTTTNKYGVIWNYKGGIFCQGDIILNGTSMISKGEQLFFVDTVNGYGIYNLKGTGTVELVNTSIVAAGSSELLLTATNMTSFSMIGGGISGGGTSYIGTNDTFEGVVLTNRGPTNMFGDAESCTWNSCGLISIGSSGSLTNCIINKSTAATAVGLINFENIIDCDFISSGTGHAIEIDPTASNTSMAWKNTDSGYASSDGSTGNETLRVSVNNGITLTINVESGKSTPTVYNTGTGTVNVVVGQVTTLITVKNQEGSVIVGARVYVVTETTGTYPSPPLADNTVIFNTLTDSNGQVSDTRSLGSSQPITGWARDSTSPPPLYKQSTLKEVIDNGSGLNLNMLLISDE